MPITFHSHQIKVPLKNKVQLKNWIAACIQAAKLKQGNISFVFCSDDYLLELNKKFLNHNTLTDIITFDYNEGNLVNGEIFISVDRVKENAEKFECNFQEELNRVMIHGILHLVGYKDKTAGDKKKMREAENTQLRKLKLFLK